MLQVCKNCKKNFEIRSIDREFYKKFDVPDPIACPDCRLQQRLCFRNERTFYKRESSLSKKPLISIYNTEAKFPVYSPQEWWSDKHDGLKFGRDFDFNRPFFEQFKELQQEVPRISLFNINPFNSDYCQQAYDNKNCYLCMVVEKCEDCMYVSHSNHLRDCFECSFVHDSELCYECLDSNKLYGCVNCQSCQNSSELINCYDCIGCQNCAGCYGLRNKQYYIMNVAYSREEYLEKLKNLEMNKYSKFLNAKAYFVELAKSLPQRATRNINVENSRGEYLINCKNSFECFNSFELEDCSYSTWIFNSHDCMDVYGLGYGQFTYQGLGVEKTNNCAFNTFVSDSSDCFYSDLCFHGMYLFGCVGLKSKKYCILNKEYKPEEYAAMHGRIIEHMKKTLEWGQFFPVELSPFAYNETAANYYFPLNREQAVAGGFSWKEADKKEFLPQNFELPDDISETDPKVCEAILACDNCGKNYKIMPQEFNFYKKRGIAIPRKCTDCRFTSRFGSRNPRKLFERKCDKCGQNIVSSFALERPEKIYCEECYKGFVG